MLAFCTLFNAVLLIVLVMLFFFFKQKTAYDVRISDWSSDVCSSDLKKVAATVEPLSKRPAVVPAAAPPNVRPPKATPRSVAAPAAAPRPSPLPPRRRTHSQATLHGHWDRRPQKGLVRPALSIDLHGHSFASAQALPDAPIGPGLLPAPRGLLVGAGP